MDIDSTDDLIRWLAEDPPAHQQDQALDDMIGVFGHDRAVKMWSRAIRSLPAGAEL